MNPHSTTHYRPDIDGLRALAVMLVVLFHADLAFPGGYIGVDVFFVISGYLITRLILADIEQARFSFAGFWIRRVKRIFPILLVVVLATLILGLVHLWPDDLQVLARSALAVLSMLSNVYFWSDIGYFDGALETQPLLHTWSLAAEEQFYLLYPVLLVVLSRYWVAGKLFFPLSVMTVLAFVLSLLVWYRFPSAAFYLLPPRGWELLVGAVLASCPLLPALNKGLRNAIASVGLLLILSSALWYDRATPFPGYSALAPVLGAAAIIYTGTVGSTFIGSLLALKPVVFVGLISYSLYLWHWPLLIFAAIRFPEVQYLGFWVIAASVVLSVLSWKLVERPFRRANFTGGKLVASLGLLLLAVLGVSVASLSTSGFPIRHAAFSTLERSSEYEVSDVDLMGLSGVPLGNAPSPENRSTADFFVIGDSHAAVMLPMFAKLASETGVSGLSLARAARKPFGNSDNLKPIHEALLQMIDLHKPRAVFLAARWTTLFPNTTVAPAYEENFALLKNIIRVSKQSNTQVWLLSQVPEYSLARATLRYQIISGSDDSLVYPSMDREVLHSSSMGVSAAFDRLVAEGARVMDLTSRFTDENGDFFLAPSQTILYWDDNHLTQAGAIELLSPVLKPVLLQLRGSGG